TDGQIQERVLTENRVIALKDVLLVGVVPFSQVIGVIVKDRVPFTIAVPGWHAEAPAILNRDKVAVCLNVHREDAGTASESQGRIERIQNWSCWGGPGLRLGWAYERAVQNCRAPCLIRRWWTHSRVFRFESNLSYGLKLSARLCRCSD